MVMKFMDRLNLKELVVALENRGLRQTASYFMDFYGDKKLTVEKVWIDKSFVERHIGPGSLMKDLDCECSTWISCPL
jgi:hypothetical protein